MTDLIERLIAASHDERLSTGVLYREAADELERLRAEVAAQEIAILSLRKRAGAAEAKRRDAHVGERIATAMEALVPAVTAIWAGALRKEIRR